MDSEGKTEDAAPPTAASFQQNDETEKNPQETLSKRQRKKQLKMIKFQEVKKAKRLRERQNRKLKRAAQATSEDDQTAAKAPSRKVLKMNKIANNPADISVVIDLSFDDLMTDKDLSSLSSQLLRSYTSNRRAKRPIPLFFTSLKRDSKIYHKLERNDGWKNWDVIVKEEHYIDAFDKSKLIYLTSDSDNVLDTLEKDAIYVIGGLVDHNHHKAICIDSASKSSIRTARLPLSEHLVIKTRTVLTVNQCFDIILGISEGESWKDTLMAVIPKRKNVTLKTNNDEVEEEEIKDK